MSTNCRPANEAAKAKAGDRVADRRVRSEQQTRRTPLLAARAEAAPHSQFKAKFILAAGLLVLPAFTATASEMGIVNGSLIWKSIPAAEGEAPWQACRRVFGQDVARSRSGSNGRASCFVPYHSLYGHGQKRQNLSQ